MVEALLKDLSHRMDVAVDVLSKEFSGLRTGRASPNLLDPIRVDLYGSMSPLNQVANVSAPEARLIVVQVWDRGMVKSVEKAIRDSDLGLNPAVDGQTIRIPIPPLTEQRRQELTKVASKYAEDAKVGVRNVRRDGMDALKKMEKDNKISEDEHKRYADKIQTITDDHVKKIDHLLAAKQKDIMQL